MWPESTSTSLPCPVCSPQQPEYHVVVPSARSPLDERAVARELDEVSDDERWLWRLIQDAERAFAAAPAGPDPDRLAEVELRYADSCAAEQRVAQRIRAAEAAIARPGSWLRPSHRSALIRHLRDDRAAAVVAAVHKGRIEQILRKLRDRLAAREEYLRDHRLTLSAGAHAQVELESVIDDLIDRYTRMPDPPAWFRFGLDYPPLPGQRAEWLTKARKALTERRRSQLDRVV